MNYQTSYKVTNKRHSKATETSLSMREMLWNEGACENKKGTNKSCTHCWICTYCT